MNSPLRIIVAASVWLLAMGGPALAQQNQVATQPAQNDVVGPPQLQNFSLNGTVTRPSETPAPVQRQPRPQPQQGAERPAQPRSEPSAASRAERAPATTPERRTAGERTEPTRSAAAPVTGILTSPGITAPAGSDTLADQDPVAVPAAAATRESGGAVPMLPWIIAALALAGAAGWYFLRQRPRESYAGAGHASAFEAPPAPAPQATAKPAAPAQPKAEPTGIVSSRLRPWLEIEFTPHRGVVDQEKAAIAFEISVLNSGSVPARDILLEASMFNAGPMLDQQLRLFFQNPVAKGEKIPVIPPFKRITVETAVFLARDQVKPIEVEGRPLFVPMVAFNALYGWGGGSKGQTSTSYLVGKQTKGEKLAPFRLDMGPRVFRNLEAREHDVNLRK